jgi:Putative flagellar system-associated repeat/Bacterial Ig-like domain
VTLKDEVRPSIAGVSYPVNGTSTISFSEPLNVANASAVEAALTIKDHNGANVSATGLVTLAADKKSFDLNIAGFTVDKDYSVTIVGLKDYAGHLVNPNPTTLTVTNKTIDNVVPTITNLEAPSTGKLKITFSEKLKATSGVIGTFKVGTGSTVNIDTTPVSGNATVDSTGKIVTVTSASLPQTAGVHTITVAGYEDLSGNDGASYSKVLQFAADTVDPTVVSHEITTINGVQYLVVKYNENVTADNAAGDIVGTYVDSNQVTRTATIADGTAVLHDIDGDGVSDSIRVALTGQAAGTYNVTVTGGLAIDGAGNDSVAKAISFTLGTLNDTTKPTIFDSNGSSTAGYGTGIALQSAEDKVTITFTENVTAATALNASNYKVEGQNVFSGAIFDGAQNVVTLTLNPDAITVDGLRNLTVSNIADVAGNVMDSVTTQLTFEENVKPVITSAALSSATQITVNFSELMTSGSLTDNDDFEVWVDGVQKQVSGVTVGSNASTYVITLANGVTDLTKPIELRVKSSNDALDQSTPGNSLKTTGTVNVTK